MKYPLKDSRQLMMLQLIRLQRCRHQEGGYSLVVTIAMTLILATLLVTAAVISKIDSASTRASNKSNTGFYSAEAGLNQRAQEVRLKFDGFNRPLGTAPVDIDGDGEIWDTCEDSAATPAQRGTVDFGCDSITFQNQETLTYVQENAANPINITIPAGEQFEGLSAQEYQYNVLSVAKDSQDLPTAILGMTFKSRVVPLFQFAIFYQNDGDFSIPPNMTINGRVHSNHDLYLNSSNAATTLRINGQVTTAGTLYRGDKAVRNTQQCAGNVVIPDAGGTARNLNCTNNTSITQYLAATTTPSNISSWGGRIGYLSRPLNVPTPSVLNPTPGSLYWDSADLRVVLKLNASNQPTGIEIRNQNNSVNTTATNALRASCPVASTTLQPEASGDDNYENNDVLLKVNSTSGFNPGDAITVGTDIDSNVIGPSGIGVNTLSTRRQLGHSYQTNPIASSTSTVRKAVVSTSDTFFNYREKHGVAGGNAGNYIRMLNVDVRSLLDCVHNQSLMGSKTLDDTTDGGLVWFFTVEGPDSNFDLAGDPDTPGEENTSRVGNTYGVRLYNGKYLRSKISGAPEINGLTIVSDQAVYLQGDYNVKDNSATPLVNEGDDLSTVGITERWRPAAVLSDSVNVLSNNWFLSDSNNRAYDSTTNLQTATQVNFDGGSRTAAETTMNVAFLSGTEVTGVDNGATTQQVAGTESGGINNYPRFHEHWSGISFNYRGSFVSLGEPRRVNSLFCGSANATDCNIYSAPVRNWDYEADFDQAQNLPPLSPRAVYLRQELFQRRFDRISSLPQRRNMLASPTLVASLPSLQPRFVF
jgi:Tfp pilus assembly protein PilX